MRGALHIYYTVMPIRNLLTLLLFVTAPVVVAQKSMEASLDSTHILIGSQARLSLTVHTPQGTTVVFPDFESKEPLTKGIEVVRTFDVDTTSQMAGTLELRRDYLITSFDTSEYRFTVPPVIIDGDTLHASDTLHLIVNTVPVDTLHLDQFYGAKEVVGEAFALNWMMVVVAVILFVFVILTLWLLSRWRKEKRRVVRTIIQLPPTEDQTALAAIALLREEIKSENDAAVIYDRLVETLRTYISSRFGIDTRLKTTPQILSALKDDKRAASLDELHTALSASDIVRFANQQSEARRDKPFAAAASFVEATKATPRLSDTEEHEELEPLSAYYRRKRVWLIAVVLSALAAIGASIWLVSELSALI